MSQPSKLYLPVANTVEEAETAYDRVLRNFVIEMGSYIESRAAADFGENWFSDLMRTGHTGEEFAGWTTVYNPSCLFGEPLKYQNSLFWNYLPNTHSFHNSLFKSRQVRNSWAHQFGAFGLSQLMVDVQHFKAVAAALDLKVARSIQGLIVRIQKILAGEFVNPESPAVTPEVEQTSAAAEREFDAAEAKRRAIERERAELEAKQPRPRIGGRWVGPKPARALRVIPKLKDIVDRQTNESIRPDLGENADEIISQWLMPKPLGDFFVDTDGAVLGYIEGEPYLFGYLGQKPKRNLSDIEGFVIRASYSWVGDDVREEGTNRLLSRTVSEDTTQLLEVIGRAVNPLDELKITTHGDLFSYSEDGPVKILRIPEKLWFPKQ